MPTIWLSTLLWGLEAEVYPAGQQLTAKVVMPVGDSGRSGVGLEAGWNRARRHDWAEHEDEQGGGPGGAVSGRWVPWRGLVTEVRADVWWMPIDWTEGGVTGRTETLVVQPTGRLAWQLTPGALVLEPGVALGREINVITRGEPVGQGAILLVGVSAFVGGQGRQ